MNNSYYVCSFIVYTAHLTATKLAEIAILFGREHLTKISEASEALSASPMHKSVTEYIQNHLPDLAVVHSAEECENMSPDYMLVGKVLSEIADICKSDLLELLSGSFANSLMSPDSDLAYQPIEYLTNCYREGEIL